MVAKKKTKKKGGDISAPTHHYKNGGSQIYKREKCPGSLEMEEDYPETEASPAALAGTRVHECIEYLLPIVISNYELISKKEAGDWYDYLFSGLVSINTVVKYTRDEIDAAILAIQDILSPRVLGDVVNTYGSPIGDSMWWEAERKYILDAKLELGGSADFSAAYTKNGKKILIIWDYKNGVTPVDAAALQLSMYGACAQYELGQEMGEDEPFDEVRCFIFQPNSSDRTATATRCDYTREEIRDVTERIKKAARISLNLDKDNKPYLSSGTHCKFCSAKASCPAYAKKVSKECVDIFDDWTGADGVEDDAEEGVYHLSDEKAIQAFKNLPYLKDYIKALEKRVVERFKGGDKLPGTKVVRRRGKRMWDKHQSVSDIEKKLKNFKVEGGGTLKKMKSISAIRKEMVEDIGIDEELAASILSEITIRAKDTLIPCLEGEMENYPEWELGTDEVMQGIIDKLPKEKS